MLWTLYLNSVGPALIALGEGVLPFELYRAIYTPLLHAVEHSDLIAARYVEITRFWLGLWAWIATLGS
jgi:hypothetical protein